MFVNITTKIYLKYIELKGFRHGNNFNIEKGANIDAAFCDMISCGDNVTITKDVYVLAHDASMKKQLGKTKIGKVKIGNNVFIGAKTVVLPGVTIGNNVVIGANSSVIRSIPPDEVWGGVLAKFLMTTPEFLRKHKEQINGEMETDFCYIE